MKHCMMKNNLQLFRKNSKLTLQGLGDICGLSKAHIHALENGTSCPRLTTAYAISSVFGATVYDIWPNEVEIVEETITVRRIKPSRDFT